MVSNANNALYQVKKMLYHHHHILITKEWWVDNHRKVIIQGEHKDRDKDGKKRIVKYFVLFKREFFLSYGAITGKGGAGESINISDFEYAVYDMEINEFLYIYPCNRIYKIRGIDIKKNATTWLNDADHREQFLFPISALQRLA